MTRALLVIVTLVSHFTLAQDTIAWKKLNVLKSISSKQDSVLAKLDSIKQAKLDSIKFLSGVRDIQRKADSLKNSVVGKVSAINGKLDSVAASANAKLDSVKNKMMGAVSGIQSGVENKLNVGQEKVDDIKGKFTEKVDQVNGVTKIDIPGKEGKEITDALGLDVPKIPELKSNLLETNLPTLNLPEASLPNANVSAPQLNTTNSTLPINAKTELPTVGNNLKLPNVENPIDQVTDKLQEVKSVAGEAGQYVQDAKQIKEKGLAGVDTEHLEKQAFNLTGASEADKKMQELNKLKLEQEQILQKYQDKKLVQAELKRKMKNVVNDQINLDNPAVAKAQEQFAKSMALAEKAKQAKGIVRAKEVNEWKGKPIQERIVPGLGFQLSRNGVFSLDLDPQVGYWLSNRFVVGIGGHYRLNISKQYSSLVQQGGVYGGRAYVDFKVVKSFYLHAEFEGLTLNKDIVPTLSEKDKPIVYSSHFGLGKQFNVSKRISAMTYAFYRLEYSGHLPGFNKYNLRLVFNLRPKKAKSTTELK